MLTLGIAGHVDHGKTSLVRALTGMETDRLPEEQRRGISIELGFAWLDLPAPTGESHRVALVDMPGHERFVRRMIAGASGIDAVLLVVAADEGAMPQGREHLAICQLLGVQRGAIVLTKADLVDAEMLDMAIGDAAELVRGTFLEGAPVWPVSVRDADRLAACKDSLAAWVAQLWAERQAQPVAAARPFLLSVDRHFVLPGRGTVVTGTAVAGQVGVEQNLQVCRPGEVAGQTFRVRSLQQQGETRQSVQSPGRVALNLAGAALGDVPVGAVICAPDSVQVGVRFDAHLVTLGHTRELPVRRRAVVHLGTASCEATIVQLSREPQPAGTARLVQVRLDQPMPLPAGERFVVRGTQVDKRHGQTLAGGQILHPAPQRHRLADSAVLEQLGRLLDPQPEVQIRSVAWLAGQSGVAESVLTRLCPLPGGVVAKTVKTLLGSGQVKRVGQAGLLMDPAQLAELERRVLAVVQAFHRAQPARPGIEAEALHRELGAIVDASVVVGVAQSLQAQGKLASSGALWHAKGFVAKAVATPALVDALVLALQDHGLEPPTVAQLAEVVGQPLRDVGAALQAAQGQGRIVRIAEDHWLASTAATAAADKVIGAFCDCEAFSTGELKELLGLTRKHLIPFAEYLDSERVTVRDPSGNRRIRERAKEAYAARRAAQAEQAAQ